MTAFALVPAYITGWLLSGDVLNLAAGWDTLGNEVADGRAWALLAAGAIAAVPILLLRSDRDVGLQEIAARHRGLLAVAAVAGLVGGTVFALGQGNRAFHDAWPTYFLVHFGLYGMTALLAAVMLLVPVLRDHVLDVEFKVQLTIRNGFVATTLGGVLLVAVQVGANMLSQAAGFTMGGVLAVGLLLCLGPVAHLGERLARRTMPSPGPLSRMPEQDRARIYQEQAQLVWADGRLNAKERRFLDGLARKLGLAAAEAHTLERSAIGQ